MDLSRCKDNHGSTLRGTDDITSGRALGPLSRRPAGIRAVTLAVCSPDPVQKCGILRYLCLSAYDSALIFLENKWLLKQDLRQGFVFGKNPRTGLICIFCERKRIITNELDSFFVITRCFEEIEFRSIPLPFDIEKNHIYV
ncbi:hypothetical protein D3C81_201690 [compost metagenome]